MTLGDDGSISFCLSFCDPKINILWVQGASRSGREGGNDNYDERKLGKEGKEMNEQGGCCVPRGVLTSLTAQSWLPYYVRAQ